MLHLWIWKKKALCFQLLNFVFSTSFKNSKTWLILNSVFRKKNCSNKFATYCWSGWSKAAACLACTAAWSTICSWVERESSWTSLFPFDNFLKALAYELDGFLVCLPGIPSDMWRHLLGGCPREARQLGCSKIQLEWRKSDSGQAKRRSKREAKLRVKLFIFEYFDATQSFALLALLRF